MSEPVPVQVKLGYSQLSTKITELEHTIMLITQSNKEKDNKIELLKLAKTQVQEKLKESKETMEKLLKKTVETVETVDVSIQTNENKLLKIVKLSQKHIPVFESKTRDIELPPQLPVINEFEEKYKELKKINYDTLQLYNTLRQEEDKHLKEIQLLHKTIKELNETLSTTHTDLLKYRGENAVLRRKLDSNTIIYPQVVSGRYSGPSMH